MAPKSNWIKNLWKKWTQIITNNFSMVPNLFLWNICFTDNHLLHHNIAWLILKNPTIVGQRSPLVRISKRYAHDWRIVTRNYVICPSVRKRLKRDSIIILKTNTSVLDQESKGVKQSCLIILCLILHFGIIMGMTFILNQWK